MGRSLTLRVYRLQLIARFGLAFAAAPCLRHLTLLQTSNSPDHYAKGTPSGIPLAGHSPPTACRHVVSGSVSSPCRGSSHLSLALLGSLSVAREYLALRDGPRGFEPTSTCPVLLRCQTGGLRGWHTGLSPTMVALSRAVLLIEALVTPSH